MKAILDDLNFRVNMAGESLVIAVAQDYETGEVLMVAFMNRDAVERTIEKGTMHYFSTSRGKIWHKGEESGHIQEVKEVLVDCDGDALLFKVVQRGAACHEGYGSCFFRRLEEDRWKVSREKVFNPKDVYK
jgi:phosphoribosyl-AMP cyclohydrolase